MVNHLLYDTVSLQIVALVLVAFWLGQWAESDDDRVVWPTPRAVFWRSVWLALMVFIVIGGSAIYYGAPKGVLGKLAVWALHIGVLCAVRHEWMRRGNRRMLDGFAFQLAQFEAIASLAFVFLR